MIWIKYIHPQYAIRVQQESFGDCHRITAKARIARNQERMANRTIDVDDEIFQTYPANSQQSKCQTAAPALLKEY